MPSGIASCASNYPSISIENYLAVQYGVNLEITRGVYVYADELCKEVADALRVGVGGFVEGAGRFRRC